MISRFLRNPHFRSASIVAKLAVNWASAIWALTVLRFDNALAPTSYREVARVVHEDMLAWPVLILSIVQTLWLWTHWRPLAFGHGGYFVLLVGWLSILYHVILANPAQPTSMAGASTISILAAFAFVSLPRSQGAGDGATAR